jgi:hypothetical protein
LLVDFTCAFQDFAHTLKVSELAADLRDVIGVDGDLTGLGTGIVDVEDELQMALSGSTGGAGDRGRVKGVTFEQGAAEEILERGELAEELARGTGGLLTSHLYRCYMYQTMLSRHILAKMFWRLGAIPAALVLVSFWGVGIKMYDPAPMLTRLYGTKGVSC